MPNLNPTPDDLGALHSPAIGPWFDVAAVTLDAPPADELYVPLTLGGTGTVFWLPPAAGVLSFFVAETARPAGLARLRGPGGSPAFTDGGLVALFRLLPGVEERLAALSGILPTLAGGVAAGTGPTRPPVRWLALEMEQAAPTFTFLDALLAHANGPVGDFAYPPGVDTDEKKTEHLGLDNPAGLTNGAGPMADLMRPGVYQNRRQALLRFTASTDVRLWAFDRRGFPVDPGAVALWWEYLAVHTNGFPNLWAPGVQQRTAPSSPGADQLTVHLTDLHGGPLTADAEARLNPTNLLGSGAVRLRGTDPGAAELDFTAPPATDDLPEAKVAALPDGRLGDDVALWPDGPVDTLLPRDFARVAVASLEHHLVGEVRHFPGTPGTPEEEVEKRRADDQNRDTTGLRVARAARGALRTTADTATAGLLDVFDGGGDTRLVAGVLERDWGVLAAALVDAACPEDRPLIQAEALVGGGEEDTGTVGEQQVLVTLTFADAPAGTWVRAWSQGFDFEKGVHFPLDGGGGAVVVETGDVHLARGVVTLPAGSVSPDAQMGIDLVVVTARGHRFHSDLRFPRPTPLVGDPVALASAGGPVVECETGTALAAPPAAGSVAPGSHLVALPAAGDPQLVDRSTVPDDAFAADTLIRHLASGDAVALTEPAFRRTPGGEAPAAFTAGGAAATRVERSLAAAWQAGTPLPSMERFEVAAANVDASGARAAVAGAPALGRSHELPPHRLGHPQCPATAEVHGTGAFLDGTAAVQVAEYVRDRVAGGTFELIEAADTPLAVPTTPSADSLWAVGLSTAAAGVGMEVGLATLLDSNLGGFSPYPFDDTWQNVQNWVQTNVLAPLGLNMPPGVAGTQAAIDSIVRALDQRVLTTARGARQAATSLVKAIRRAQELIYVETAALDDFELGAANDKLHLAEELRLRMDAVPGLRLVLCTPRYLPHGTPRSLQRVRDDLLAQAAAALAGGGRGARIAHFRPAAGPGRSLRLATTTVVIDDCYAVTGTTHLWRRGLSFDSSYAVAMVDDQLADGRSREVHAFRRALLAGRLGLVEAQLPDDPEELVAAIRTLVERGGFGRLAVESVERRDPTETTTTDPEVITEEEVWNPDGSPPAGFDPVAFVAGLMIDVQQDELNPAP